MVTVAPVAELLPVKVISRALDKASCTVWEAAPEAFWALAAVVNPMKAAAMMMIFFHVCFVLSCFVFVSFDDAKMHPLPSPCKGIECVNRGFATA